MGRGALDVLAVIAFAAAVGHAGGAVIAPSGMRGNDYHRVFTRLHLRYSPGVRRPIGPRLDTDNVVLLMPLQLIARSQEIALTHVKASVSSDQ